MATDAELLRSYACDRSESAFAELAQRHIDLVYSAALREAAGNASLAEDVTQAVFTELARQASKLSRHPALAGWLYTCVRRMTANVRRAEDRRRRREREALTMNEPFSADASDPVWRRLEPVLDDAMHELSEADRIAVVLRFFEEQSLKEVGLALGITENAARMRVDRALERLQKLLSRRGISSTAAGLAAAIITGAVLSAPANLAANVVTGALAATAASATTTFTLLKLMTMTKLKAGVLAAVAVAGTATPFVLQQHQTQVQLRTENESLRQQVGQFATLRAENERMSNLLGQASSSQLSQDQLRELMKLRGEVSLLRRQTNELGRVRDESRRLQATLAKVDATQQEQAQELTGAELLKQAGIAKMNYAKHWVLAFLLYAEQNQGQFPISFEQALPFLSEEAQVEMKLAPGEFLPNTPKYGLTPDHYEIVYRGALAKVPNASSVIVLREKQAWPLERGGWSRAYGFADGHSEIHLSKDGNFDAWERERMLAPALPNQ